MQLRGYQNECVEAVIRDMRDGHQRVLVVAATGAGKTIIVSRLMQLAKGRCLFLADAKELVYQNADKYQQLTGMMAGVEMANQHCTGCESVVVATMQSMVNRLHKYNPDHFSLIIIDEAHRNTLGAQAQEVLEHFSGRVLGVTAAPHRTDRKQLGDYYEKISYEIGLRKLIEMGYLSRIIIQSVPVQMSLNGVRTKAGDYHERDLSNMIEPHIQECASLLKEYALNRNTVVFLPLIETSKMFVEACNSIGLKAVHVDGKDRDGIQAYNAGEYNIISNASLLTTGWDSPKTDCVYILRPTKSHSLYSQMVGRGTRIMPGKENLLLLDPLFLTDKMNLMRPANLMTGKEQDTTTIDDLLRQAGYGDLLELEEKAVVERESRLAEEIKKNAKKKKRLIDVLDFALSLYAHEAIDYEPEMAWEKAPVTDNQKQVLEKFGFDIEGVTCKGHASKIIDLLMQRKDAGLASPKQVRLLRRLRHPNPDKATMAEAGRFLDQRIKRK